MNREGLKKHWEVVKAWVFDGAEIEALSTSYWFLCPNPNFLPGTKYRVKPQPQTRTAWANVYPNPDMGACHPTREEANAAAGTMRVACVPVTVTWTEGEGLK